MAKNVEEIKDQVEAQELPENKTAQEQPESKKIKVEREPYEKDGNTYFTHFIRGKVRGRDIRVAVVPPDRGGYVVLDIVYDNAMECDLVIKPFEIKDEKSGNVIKGNTYSVVSVDDDGTVYECPIKPFRSSDKVLLNMLLR